MVASEVYDKAKVSLPPMPIQRARAVERAALWARADWLIAFGLMVLTALTRLPFRTRMIYAWDGGLFARALQNYDVVPHFPQPPGYIFYVGTGKLVQALTGLGANDTYVAISIGAASLTVAVLYLLGRLIFGRTAGLLAAGLAVTSVSFWFFSELAYPYTVLALGSTVLALICWLLATRRFPWPPLAALVFGLVAGFRQDLLLFLGPLFAVCYVAALGSPGSVGRRIADGAWLRRVAAQLGLGLLAGAAGIAAWSIATDLASEGWGSLWRALTIQSTNVEQGTSGLRDRRGRAARQWDAPPLVQQGCPAPGGFPGARLLRPVADPPAAGRVATAVPAPLDARRPSPSTCWFTSARRAMSSASSRRCCWRREPDWRAPPMRSSRTCRAPGAPHAGHSCAPGSPWRWRR